MRVQRYAFFPMQPNISGNFSLIWTIFSIPAANYQCLVPHEGSSWTQRNEGKGATPAYLSLADGER